MEISTYRRTTVSAFFIPKRKRRKNMKFKNKNHQAVFNGEAHKMNRQDDVKMAVLYLLTADVQLWNASKKHIKKGNIDLESIRVKNSNLKAYTLCGILCRTKRRF